jgi:hypothetical protein
MKKILLFTIGCLSLLSSIVVSAQTFTTAADTIYLTVSGDYITSHNDITNISAQNIDIRWSAVTDFPNDWKALLGICDAQVCADINGHMTSGAPYAIDTAKLFDMQISAGFSSVTPGTHYVTATVRDITNTSGTVKSVTWIVTKFPTGVAKTTKVDDDITLYPNPARNELNVLFSPDAGVKIISVYNLIGKAVNVYKLTSNNSAKLDIENLASGIYFIRLINGQGQVIATRKFTHQ